MAVGDQPRREMLNQCRRVSASASIGVRAHGADLGGIANVHAVSGHGDQLVTVTNADVVAEHVSALKERTRLGEFHERKHVGNVVVAQGDDVVGRRSCVVEWSKAIAHHLGGLAGVEHRAVRWNIDRCGIEQQRHFAGSKHVGDGRNANASRVWEADEQCHSGIEPQRRGSAAGEVGLMARERVPDRVVELVSHDRVEQLAGRSACPTPSRAPLGRRAARLDADDRHDPSRCDTCCSR